MKNHDTHVCPVATCSRTVPMKHLMCQRHWAMVSPSIQRRVIEAYRPGQNWTTANQVWWEAARDAVAEASRAQRRSLA